MAGCGTVGAGVVRLLGEQREEILRRAGIDLELARVVVRDPGKDRGVDLPAGLASADLSDLLADEVDVVVELIGGCEAARDVVQAAIRAGKHVVTANKALIALHGAAVFAEAAHRGVIVAIEATCCGGIPVINAIQRGLVANRIDALYGIVNGTCNYILTEMLDSRKTYADALADAQRLGYAEADPTMDVDGTDSAHKVAILGSLAFASPMQFSRVRVQGIDRLTLGDLLSGHRRGWVCKLLASARRHEDGFALEVGPTFLPASHALARVDGSFNAVSLLGHAVGHSFYCGRGAGGGPTASSVMADIIAVAAGLAPPSPYPIPAAGATAEGTSYQPLDDLVGRYYLRASVRDVPGVLADIAGVFARHEVGLSELTLGESDQAAAVVTAITQPAGAGGVRAVAKASESIETVTQPPAVVRIRESDEEF